ncbi:MAG TPA: polysaccharide biosynthesis/export family protein [Vicinamibacteria bacterium]|nr:polysaccharide biosynthesis/export family protein [Vicinamibacteria bacterium]
MKARLVGAILLFGPALTAEDATPYRVGPGDVLEVIVDGRPDLSRLPTVQTTGRIWLPRAGEVEVSGLTSDEVAARVTPLLAAEDLAAPRVAVRVKEFHSQFLWVKGAVERPGRKPLRAGTRLVDALLDAGGFVAGASGEVTLERPGGGFPDGSRSRSFRFTGGTPTPEELDELGVLLRSGDVVTAVTQRWVTVSGAVRRPGRYPYVESMTVGRLVEAAGGVLRSGSEKVVVRRASGEIEADLEAIRDGKADDVALVPNDEVVVRARRL